MAPSSSKATESSSSNKKLETVLESILTDRKKGKIFKNWFFKSETKSRQIMKRLNVGGEYKLRRETKYNRPTIYGFQLPIENVKNNGGALHPCCLVNIRMSHQASDDRIRRKITSKSITGFQPAKEIFRLPVDPLAENSFNEVKSEIQNKIGFPLCTGLARHLELPYVTGWVMMTQANFQRLLKGIKKEKKPETTTKIFSEIIWHSKHDVGIPEELSIDEKKVVCFNTKRQENMKFVECNGQFLFTEDSIRKSANEQFMKKTSPICSHSSRLIDRYYR